MFTLDCGRVRHRRIQQETRRSLSETTSASGHTQTGSKFTQRTSHPEWKSGQHTSVKLLFARCDTSHVGEPKPFLTKCGVEEKVSAVYARRIRIKPALALCRIQTPVLRIQTSEQSCVSKPCTTRAAPCSPTTPCLERPKSVNKVWCS